MTAQLRQTALARSTCSSAGPVVPTGKNSSGSSSRHAACWRQSMKNSLSRLVGGRFLGRNATLRRQHCGELHRERRIPPGTLSHIFWGMVWVLVKFLTKTATRRTLIQSEAFRLGVLAKFCGPIGRPERGKMPVFDGVSPIPVVVGHRGLRRPGLAEN